MKYRELRAPDMCPSCIAWHCEFQRAALLLETLAEDHFPDQASFTAWEAAQMTRVYRSKL